MAIAPPAIGKMPRPLPTVFLRLILCQIAIQSVALSPPLEAHLITSRHGGALSKRVAAAFIYDPIHAGEAPQQMIATTQIASKHPRVARILKQMENLIDSPPTIEALS